MQITRITILLFATRATQHNTEWMSKIYLESVSFWWFDNFFSTSIPYWINITTDKRKKHWDKYERFGRVSVIIQFYDCRPRSANEGFIHCLSHQKKLKLTSCKLQLAIHRSRIAGFTLVLKYHTFQYTKSVQIRQWFCRILQMADRRTLSVLFKLKSRSAIGNRQKE